MELSFSPTRFGPFSRDGCSHMFSFFEPICIFAGEIQSIWAHSFNLLSCCLMRTILCLQILQSVFLAAMISCLWRTWVLRSSIPLLPNWDLPPLHRGLKRVTRCNTSTLSVLRGQDDHTHLGLKAVRILDAMLFWIYCRSHHSMALLQQSGWIWSLPWFIPFLPPLFISL